MIPQRYEIRVQGGLTASLQTAFRPLGVHTEDDGRVTVMSGMISDQAELTGILNAIDSLGLVLIEIRPVADEASASRTER